MGSKNTLKTSYNKKGGSGSCPVSAFQGREWNSTTGGTYLGLNKIEGPDVPRMQQNGGKRKTKKHAKRSKRKTRKHRKKSKTTKRKQHKKRSYRKIKGGGVGTNNLLSQDFVNLHRGAQYNVGSAYNTLNGYPQPVNPMPWNQPSLESIDSTRYKII